MLIMIGHPNLLHSFDFIGLTWWIIKEIENSVIQILKKPGLEVIENVLKAVNFY